MHRNQPIVFVYAVALMLLGVPKASCRAADKVDFASQIQPLLVQRCGKCHGEEKAMGKLRLHTAEAIKAFHEDHLLVASKPDESELFQRITLPADDKKRMPKGADPLPQAEIDLIRAWIEQGAQFTSIATDAPAADAATAESETPKETEEKRPDLLAPLAGLSPAADEAIAKIQEAGAAVMPIFAGSPLLQVSFAQAEKPADDAAIAALTDAAEQIVWLNLAGSQASPSGYAPLAKLKNLNQLHLEKSQVNDEALAHLANLPLLEYLNVYDTSVTDAGLAHLQANANLQKLYLWNTKVSYEAAMGWQGATPGREANLGWNHPEIAKRRLAKQLEQAKVQTEETKARAAELETQLKAAQEAQKQAADSLQQLEDELKKLTEPEAENKGDAAAAAQPAEGEAPPAEKDAAKEPEKEAAKEEAKEEAK